MTLPAKSNALQSYQLILYNKALHPELFALKARRVVRGPEWELEMWVWGGSHVLRFESGPLCASELATSQEEGLPEKGAVAAFLCAGERDFEHCFEKERVLYMNTVQTEQLSGSLYLSTRRELLDMAKESGALVHEWRDESGPCASILDAQRFNREAHIQAYHLIASGGVVIRTQTIFEKT